MKRVLSTHLFVNHRLTTAMLERIRKAEIAAVEIFCARQHLDWHNSAQMAELGHWFRDSDLELWSLHSPMYTDEVWGRSGPNSVISITETVKSRRLQMVGEIKRVLEIAEVIPVRYLIQHLGASDEEYDDSRLEAAFSALEEISLFARQRGVNVLLENIPNAFSSAERLLMFLNQTHLPLDFCFDTGHAHMREGIERAFELMKGRIRSTHVHDNDGVADRHLFPKATGGTVDWSKTMKLLRSKGDQLPLLLELIEVPDMARPLDEVRQTFERLESLE